MHRQSNFNFWQNEPKFQRREFGCARDSGLDRMNNSLCAPAHWPTKSWHGAVPACPGLLIVRSDAFAVPLCRGQSPGGASLTPRALPAGSGKRHTEWGNVRLDGRHGRMGVTHRGIQRTTPPQPHKKKPRCRIFPARPS